MSLNYSANYISYGKNIYKIYRRMILKIKLNPTNKSLSRFCLFQYHETWWKTLCRNRKIIFIFIFHFRNLHGLYYSLILYLKKIILVLKVSKCWSSWFIILLQNNLIPLDTDHLISTTFQSKLDELCLKKLRNFF